MAYSSIRVKKCKCSENCDKWPTLGFSGFFSAHAPEEIKERESAKTRKYRKSLRSNIQTKVRSLNTKEKDLLEKRNNLNLWYSARRYEMTGRCLECNRSTNKESDKYFRWSVSHIVPKSLVESVSLHSQNWLELCQDHHNLYDSTFEAASKMKIFQEAKRKFQQFKDLIPPEELRKVNPFLLDAEPPVRTKEQHEKQDK